MRQSLATIALVVRDYDEAIAWFTGKLGFTLEQDLPMGGKRWVVVAPRGGAGARLLLARADGPKQEARIGDQTGGRVFLFLETDDFDRDEAVRRCTSDPAATIRTVLLDQHRVAGLGNLWANELCFVRGVHPDRAVGDVDVPAALDTARRMLRHSASVPDAYQVTTGVLRRGERHWVVGRAGRPCLRCGTRVRARDDVEVVGSPSRRLWWCPRCQPAPPTR